MSTKKFYCPHCEGNVNPNQKVITVAKTETGKKGLVLQNETYGDYKYITDASFKIQKGEKLTHSCPLCHGPLQSDEFPHCSELIVIEDDKKGHIFFANDDDIQATFVRWESGETQVFGKDRKSFFPGFESHANNFEDHETARMQ